MEKVQNYEILKVFVKFDVLTVVILFSQVVQKAKKPIEMF